jgi:hypothetical protein
MPKKTQTQNKTDTAKQNQEKNQPGVQLLVGAVQSNESTAAILACNQFLRMGPGRSVRGLASAYRKMAQNSAPTQSYSTLRSWSEKFDWSARAVIFDADEDEERHARRMAEFRSGLAEDYERVSSLKRLGAFLEEQIYEQGQPRAETLRFECQECGMTNTVHSGEMKRPYHNVWVPDVKAVGSGELAEKVDVERFNPSLLSEFRSTLDDIAKEVGQRQKDSTLSHIIKIIEKRIDFALISPAQTQRMVAGEHWLTILLEPYLRDDK